MKSLAVDAAEEAVLSKMGDFFSLKREQSMALSIFLNKQHVFTLLATGFDNRWVKDHGALRLAGGQQHMVNVAFLTAWKHRAAAAWLNSL